MLSDAGEDVHFTQEDQFERSVRIRCADQFGMLNAATQKKIVSAARRDTHPHSLPVDVFDSAKRRSRRHEVSTFDLNIRSGEINLVCPARIDRQECHVPSPSFTASTISPAESKATSSAGKLTRFPSSYARSTATPQRTPLPGSLVASTGLP